MKKILLLLITILCFQGLQAQTEVNLTSWKLNTTGQKGSYKKYVNINSTTGGTTSVTMTDSTEVIAVCYDNTYIYIKSDGIAGYEMGPWYQNPNVPSAMNYIFRLPRTPAAAGGTKTSVPTGGAVALAVNGVVMYGYRDSRSYSSTSNTNSFTGDGKWNADAWVSEGTSMDASGGGHSTGGGEYHYHANPVKLYTEPSTTHSPIIGFALDGYPIYGPYGYTTATNSSSAIKRMKSSYKLRSITTRTTFANGTTSSPAGPVVSTSFPLGTYIEDYEYSAGTGDLDEYNGRTCVTPEYPNGTYAYFISTDDSGNPAFPYIFAASYYGTVANTDIQNKGKSTIPTSGVTCLSTTSQTPTLTYTGATSGNAGTTITLSATTNSSGTVSYSVASGTGSATISGTTLTLVNAGTVTLTVTVAASGNYATKSITQTITINTSGSTVTPTITFADISKTYGDADFTAAATSNSSGAITYSITSGANYASITSAGVVTITGAGTVSIQASQAATTGYSAATKTSTLTISKPTLMVMADNKTRVYNTANPTLTVSYSGFVKSETSTVLLTQPTITTTATQSSSVGDYVITPSGATATNYTVMHMNGTLSVTSATPTISYTGATSGNAGSTITLSATSTSSGTISYSVANGTGQATVSGTTLSLVSAGTVTLTINVAASGNYAATSTTQSITINTAGSAVAPTITFNNISKNYGDANFTASATSNSSGAITYSITAGASFASITSAGVVTITGAGSVTIQASQAAATGYTSGTKTATLTIGKPTLMAQADNKSRVYNTANPTFTITYSGFVKNETSSVLTSQATAATTATQTSNVGTYPITVSGGAAANYTIMGMEGTLTITQATPTITYTGQTTGNAGSVLTLSATSTSTGAITYSVANGTGQASLSGSNLTLSAAGTVTLTINVAATTNYAAATKTQTITIQGALAAEDDNFRKSISVYPNPATEYLAVKSTHGYEQMDVQIFNSFGTLIFKARIRAVEDLEYLIPVSDYKSGLYLVQIESYGKMTRRKFIR
jgi:hypothetical protein